MAERTRVARGWQGRADLIQLVGPPSPPCDSGPAGTPALGSCSLCAKTMHMDAVHPPSALTPPTPTSGTCGLPRTPPNSFPAREGDRGLPRKVGKLWLLLSSLWPSSEYV